jgi:hypothetical protein
MAKITINWLPVWLSNDHLKDRNMPLTCVNCGRNWDRTSDPSLVRRVPTVAGRGWTWPGVASASHDCGWTWPDVA